MAKGKKLKDPVNKYSDEFYQDLMCAAISSTQRGIKRLCSDFQKEYPDFPSHMSFIRWIAEEGDFCSRYAHAKDEQMDTMADEIIEICDDDSLDIAFKEDGTPFVNQEHINRSKLRIETRKWLMAKLKPKKYGDKVTQELTGVNGTALDLTVNFVSPRG